MNDITYFSCRVNAYGTVNVANPHTIESWLRGNNTIKRNRTQNLIKTPGKINSESLSRQRSTVLTILDGKPRLWAKAQFKSNQEHTLSDLQYVNFQRAKVAFL